jgi:hypothetical protein
MLGCPEMRWRIFAFVIRLSAVNQTVQAEPSYGRIAKITGI